MKKDTIMMVLVNVGMLLIAAGILLPMFQGINGILYKILYCIGAPMLLVGRAFSQYKGKDMRLKRLYRIEVWAALFFCVGAVMMFYPPGNNLRDVLAFTLAGGGVQVFTSLMIPIRQRKLEQEEKEAKEAKKEAKK